MNSPSIHSHTIKFMKKDISTLIILGILSIGSSFLFYQCRKTPAPASTSTIANNQPANEITIQNMSYSPSSITVKTNTTVKWTNKDGTAHTVTSSTGLFDSGNINNGDSYSHQFTSAGTYTYKCTIHSGMTGTITVN
ncbi:MAG: cupredoxin domain-containing protein [Bacteroidia bacterium]